MAANNWIAKLGISPEAMCRCGHNAHVHHHGKDCTAVVDESRMAYCKCQEFREHQFKNQEEVEMTKKNGVKKKKSEGRKPTLAPYVDSPFKIWMTTGGRECEAQVLSSGIIRIDEKEFTSPSSAGSYILGKDDKGNPLQVDGWKSWRFNKDGERVPLDTLRGSKSPLKLVEPKAKKPRKPKAKKPRATRAKKAPATETQAETQAA